MLATVDTIDVELRARRDTVLALQQRISQERIEVAEILVRIARSQAEIRDGIFTRGGPPLWSVLGSERDSGSVIEDVREAVGTIIGAEDPLRPLSDDDVVKALVERGYKLARRTVAKYRKELGIPSSYRRRHYS